MTNYAPYCDLLESSLEAELLAFTTELADVSAAVIKRYYRTGFDVITKADESPVTIADRQAELEMRELIMRRYPAHGIVGEEFGVHQPEAEFQWVLDPIDGTKAFVSGTYLFGTLIGLTRAGKPVVGVINQPIVGDFLAGTARETRLNGQVVRVRPCAAVEQALLCATEHWNVWQYQNGSAFEALTRQVKRYNNWGDCHGYYLVATGGIDIMIDPIMNIWDLIALIPVIEGAGGVITDYTGGSPLSGNGTVATAGGIHADVIARLAGRRT
jgi:myo-inositol-1(or 4)-monophosphatase